MQDVYFISGLGADERAFQLLELKNINSIHLPWQNPLPNETIEEYALRFSKNITSDNPIIVGLSFGGMMSIEIAKHISYKKIILISSAKTKKEIPTYFKLAKYFPFYKIIPFHWLGSSTYLMNYIFGNRTQQQKEILKELIKNSNSPFNKWAIEKAIHWKNKFIPTNVFHIHGNSDNLLPHKYVKANFIIQNGTHFMIANQAKEISILLEKIISS